MGDFGTRRSSSLRSGDGDAPLDDAPAPAAPDKERDLAGALHEVSNALTVVMGWLGRARDASQVPAEVERAVDVAAARASQARAIVRRAIGAEVTAETPLGTADVVRDAVLGLEPEAKNASVTIAAAVDDEAAALALPDASRVVQILTNLLLNAVAVSPSGARVLVDARAEPADADGRPSVVLGVVDEGPGVPLERRATLFDAGVTTRRGGAGIGLKYAAAMARAAGGELRLAPSAMGARFELAWPALHSKARPAVDRAPSSVTRGRLPLEGTRILILEDDVAVVDLLDTALTARGAAVVSIHHRRELERALGSGPFDAALFDISPIQADIQGALGAVRDKSVGARLVVISGSAEEMPPLPPDWVAAWVRKPFEIAEILAALVPPG